MFEKNGRQLVCLDILDSSDVPFTVLFWYKGDSDPLQELRSTINDFVSENRDEVLETVQDMGRFGWLEALDIPVSYWQRHNLFRVTEPIHDAAMTVYEDDQLISDDLLSEAGVI